MELIVSLDGRLEQSCFPFGVVSFWSSVQRSEPLDGGGLLAPANQPTRALRNQPAEHQGKGWKGIAGNQGVLPGCIPRISLGGVGDEGADETSEYVAENIGHDHGTPDLWRHDLGNVHGREEIVPTHHALNNHAASQDLSIGLRGEADANACDYHKLHGDVGDAAAQFLCHEISDKGSDYFGRKPQRIEEGQVSGRVAILVGFVIV